jgi:hypothetical protein
MPETACGFFCALAAKDVIAAHIEPLSEQWLRLVACPSRDEILSEGE